MKRLPLLSSFILFLVLCMSIAFWGMRFYKPKMREIAAPVAAVTFEPIQGQWGRVFGAGQTKAAVSEYQLKGVVIAYPASESLAIFSINSGPTTNVGIGQELSPGVALREVHPNFILVGDGASSKRVDLPANATNTNGAPSGGDVNNNGRPVQNFTPPAGVQTRVVPVPAPQEQMPNRGVPNQPNEPQVPPNAPN